ncbi:MULTISPECIES: glycosyltransferase family 2 protein [Bacteroidales]
MPVYNGARFLPYTIDNILAQSYRNIELIIVDDGSIDDSYNIAKQYVNKSKRRGG